MINFVFFTIGFIIYLIFNVVTFKVYSKKQEATKKYILFFIYVYYTILGGYVIQLVDYSVVNNNFLEIVLQIVIFAAAGGLYMVHYYNSIITPEDEKYDSNFRNVQIKSQ